MTKKSELEIVAESGPTNDGKVPYYSELRSNGSSYNGDLGEAFQKYIATQVEILATQIAIQGNFDFDTKKHYKVTFKIEES